MIPRKIKPKIVLAPFLFDDLLEQKIRPALKLTRVIGPYRQTVLFFIISKAPAVLLASDLILDSSAANFALTGLKVTSTLRLHLLYTIADEQILRELGQLPAEYHTQVEDRLRQLFGL